MVSTDIHVGEETMVGRDTAINAYHGIRKGCSTKLHQAQIQLAGPSKVVQIDESLSSASQMYSTICHM